MKKYLFIFMIINIFFITNVYGISNSEVSNQQYINLNPNGRQVPIQNVTCSNGTNCSIYWEWQENEMTITNNNVNVIMFTPFISTFTVQTPRGDYFPTSQGSNYIFYQLNESDAVKIYFRIMLEFWDTTATSYCDSTATSIICRLNGKKLKGIYYQVINFEGSQQQSLIMNGRIGLNATIGKYSNTSDLAEQQQQQHQEIMQNDPTTYNNGIESIAGNTQLPNNSGLFDVLSSLSSFVGQLSASGSCSPISIPIPFTTQNLRLPCMTTEVYAPNFPELLAIWQLIVRGLVYYYIIVNMLKLLKDTIDPFSMKLEVLDL